MARWSPGPWGSELFALTDGGVQWLMDRLVRYGYVRMGRNSHDLADALKIEAAERGHATEIVERADGLYVRMKDRRIP